ncbi:MAG: efflux RND transporter periplasmic adaptor subunit [Eubacteriales bacterium]|nr:efflux RND transporter periplasmic adaptor subunit [Eubacteriales bacterium]
MKKKKPFWKILLYILLIIIVVLMVVLPFMIEAATNAEGDNASILSVRAEKKNIEKNISGTGMLADEEAVEIELPYGVEITKYLVDNNDFVTEGTPLVAVDRVGVMNAIYEYQDDMSYVEEQMRLYTDNGASSFLTTSAKGRVMELYAEVGDSISDVMLEHGALAVISLDGLMAVDAKGLDAYPVGSTLYVADSGGGIVPGRIESRKQDISVITLNQEGETSGDHVEILDGEFNVISEGTLYVHSALKISGYSGTIEAVHVVVDQDLAVGQTVFTYTGNPATAEYGVYAARHRELEELTEKLFKMYTDGTINAPCTGLVTGIDEDAAAELLAAKVGEKAHLDFLKSTSITPELMLLADEEGKIPTENYFRVGIITSYTVNEDATGQFKYKLSKETFSSEQEVIQFLQSESGEYDSISEPMSFPGYSIKAENISLNAPIIFSYSGGSAEVSGASVYSASGSSIPSGMSLGGMSFGGFSAGGTAAAATHEYYSTKTTKPLSVVPQDTVTVDITIDELDILSIERGQSALVTLDALAGQSFEGVITDIGVSGSNSGGNSKYSAEVTLKRAPNMIAGMNATANITISTKEAVLTVPAEAIVEDGARSFVYTGYDEKEELLIAPADITTGASDGINVEVLSGLTEGQEVWYTYYDKPTISFDFPGFG